MKLTTWTKTLFIVLLAAGRLSAETDAELEATGLHRVRPGETVYGLAKRAGMSPNAFQRLNDGGAFDWRLMAGKIVMMRNPHEYGKVIAKKEFGGRYSIHEYSFYGRGPAHGEEDDGSWSGRGSEIRCDWCVAWPEAACGLSGAALKKLRAHVISSCFFDGPYGERKRFATIEAAEKHFKAKAWKLFDCRWDGWPTNDSHYCSQWRFGANLELTWPFGTRKRGEEWYERPVICFKNDGYSSDGGHGCSGYLAASVYSIPDGRELDENDYFREDRMDELFDLIVDRLFRDNNLTIEDTIDKDRSKIDVGPGMLCWNVSEKGATWWVSPYHIFQGCHGVTRVSIPWKDLLGFLKEPK